MIAAFDVPTPNHDYTLSFASQSVATRLQALVDAKDSNPADASKWSTLVAVTAYLHRQVKKSRERERQALKESFYKELSQSADRFLDDIDTWARATGYTSSHNYRKIFGLRGTYQIEQELIAEGTLIRKECFRSREASHKNHFYVITDFKDAAKKEPKAAFAVVFPRRHHEAIRAAILDLNAKIEAYNHSFYDPTGFDFSAAIEAGINHPSESIAKRLESWKKTPANAAYYSTNGTNGHTYSAVSNIPKELRKLIAFKHGKTSTNLSEVDISAAYPAILPTTVRALLTRTDFETGSLSDKLDSEKNEIDMDAIETDLARWEILSQSKLGFYKSLIQVSGTAYTLAEIKTAALIFLFDDPKRKGKRNGCLAWFSELVATVFPALYNALRGLKSYLGYKCFAHRVQLDGKQILQQAIQKYRDPKFMPNSIKPGVNLSFAPIIDCLLVPKTYAQRAHKAIKTVLEALNVNAPVKVTHNRTTPETTRELIKEYNRLREAQAQAEALKEKTGIQEQDAAPTTIVNELEWLKTALEYTDGLDVNDDKDFVPVHHAAQEKIRKAIQGIKDRQKAQQARTSRIEASKTAELHTDLRDYLRLDEGLVAVALQPHRDGNYIIPHFPITQDTQIQELPVFNFRTNWYSPARELTTKKKRTIYQASDVRMSYAFFMDSNRDDQYWKHMGRELFAYACGFDFREVNKYLDAYHFQLFQDVIRDPDYKRAIANRRIEAKTIAYAIWIEWQNKLSRKDKTRPVPRQRDWIEVYAADNRCQRYYYKHVNADEKLNMVRFAEGKLPQNSDELNIRRHAQVAFWPCLPEVKGRIEYEVKQHNSQMHALEINYAAANKYEESRLGEGFRKDMLTRVEFAGVRKPSDILRESKAVYAKSLDARHINSILDTLTTSELPAPELYPVRVLSAQDFDKAERTREYNARHLKGFRTREGLSQFLADKAEREHAQTKSGKSSKSTKSGKTSGLANDLDDSKNSTADLSTRDTTQQTQDDLRTRAELHHDQNPSRKWRICIEDEKAKIILVRNRLDAMLSARTFGLEDDLEFGLSAGVSQQDGNKFGVGAESGCSGTLVALSATQAQPDKKRNEHSVNMASEAPSGSPPSSPDDHQTPPSSSISRKSHHEAPKSWNPLTKSWDLDEEAAPKWKRGPCYC